jgi:small-conductance mechanosensitive channel
MEDAILKQLIEMLSFAHLAKAALTLALAWLALRGIYIAITYLSNKFPRYRLQFGQSFPVIRLLTWALVVGYIVVGILDPPESVVYATLGSIGLAIGLAAQDGIRNLLAGVMIIFNPPFRVGDMVTLGGHYGEVTRLDLSVTWLRTFDDNVVMVPNAEVLRQAVVNANSGALTEMLVIPIDLPLGVPLGEAKEVAEDVTRCSPYTYLPKPVIVVFESRYDHRPLVRMSIKAYVLDVRYERALASDVTERILEGFANRGWLESGIALKASQVI